MKVQSLGHVVLKVRNRERSEAFYKDVLGLPLVARMEEYKMAFFSLGNHHDFAIAEVGDDAAAADTNMPGLAHVAFKIGDDLGALKRAKADLDAAGVKTRAVDHGVSQSLYFNDPDGNGLEVYVDGTDAWREDPQLVAHSEPLDI